jgi:uncharacterized protein YgiM (DUF1202 family)
MKKTVSILLALMLVLVSVCTITTASAAGPQTMYITSANGKSVNVRSGPGKQYEVIGSLRYGEKVGVDWTFVGNPSWAKIVWGGYGDAFVMTQFLTDKKPGPRPTPAPEPDPKKAERKKYQAELNSERSVEPYYIVTQPSRSSGWVNFRSGPSKTTAKIRSFSGGQELLVIAETNNWYKAEDSETGKTGYLSKAFAIKSGKEIAKTTGDGTEKLGTLSVNGEFDLTCRLPEDYKLQVVNTRGEKIIASVLSDDMTKPEMYLTIAYDETYSDVERMNDLSEEDLKILEESFSDMNDVNITYRETGHGTKLLIAREVGSDTDFVDILAIYKGYFIEFNMTPNPKAANQALTDEQIKMCIDFLTDVDFNIPEGKTDG